MSYLEYNFNSAIKPLIYYIYKVFIFIKLSNS
nr:MAG TPA: hypothetical protein [Caudoviricetes sp.]